MTVVRSQFIDLATGLPAPGVRVYARLVAPATWLRGQSVQVTGTYETVSGEDGWYELELPPQSAYEVAGTYYRVREWENATWDLEVPDSGPALLRDCLVNPPPETADYSPISRLSQLRDVDLTEAAPARVLVCGDDGVWRPKPMVAAAQWGDSVTFSEAAPDIDDAPDGAIWVHVSDEMKIYRKGS